MHKLITDWSLFHFRRLDGITTSNAEAEEENDFEDKECGYPFTIALKSAFISQIITLIDVSVTCTEGAELALNAPSVNSGCNDSSKENARKAAIANESYHSWPKPKRAEDPQDGIEGK